MQKRTPSFITLLGIACLHATYMISSDRAISDRDLYLLSLRITATEQQDSELDPYAPSFFPRHGIQSESTIATPKKKKKKKTKQEKLANKIAKSTLNADAAPYYPKATAPYAAALINKHRPS